MPESLPEPASLPETLKAQIVAEERFRQEVKRQIQPQPTRIERMLAFLGSSLGIWLLSTVAVGFLSWSYAQIQESVKSRAKTEEVTRQLDSELTTRLRIYASSLQGLDVGAYHYGNALWGLYEREHPSLSDFRPVPAGSSRSDYKPTLSFLIELGQLAGKGGEQAQIAKATRAWIVLLDTLRKMQIDVENEDRNHELCDFVGRRLAQERIVKGYVPSLRTNLEAMRLKRWQVDENTHALDLFAPVTANPDPRARAGLNKGDEHFACKDQKKPSAPP